VFLRYADNPEFAAIATTIYEHFKSPVTGRVFFTDTKDANVEKAAYLGIVNGIGNDRFAPDSLLTREQAAVMLTRLARLLGISERDVGSHHFSDEIEISSWAYLDVKQAQSLGIMGGLGDGQFSPRLPYIKEQCIVTILRVYDLVN